MPRLRDARRLFRWPLGRSSRIETDVDEELNSHLERRIEELTDQGVDRERARRTVLEEFGDLEATRRYCTRMTRRTLSELRCDVVFAANLPRRNPGLALVVVLALALSIGASSMILTIVDHEVRPLGGIMEPARLRSISGDIFYQAYLDHSDHDRAFSELAAWRETRIDVGLGDTPHLLGNVDHPIPDTFRGSNGRGL